MEQLIIAADSPYMDDVLRLHDDAFAKNDEGTPHDVLKSMMDSGDAVCSVYIDDGFVGFTYIIHYGTLEFLLYLAVSPEKRGAGYGHMMLDALKHSCSLPIVLNSETDEGYDVSHIRHRRIQFYKRNGFEHRGLMLAFNHIVFKVLCNEEVSKDDYTAAMYQYAEVCDLESLPTIYEE